MSNLEPQGRESSRPAHDLAAGVYDELKRLARGYMHRERPDHTLDPTALAHEAFLRLSSKNYSWQGRTHFLAIAANEMRRVLVESARARNTLKRGGKRTRVTLSDRVVGFNEAPLDVLAVDQALERLNRRSTRQCRVVEMRLFAGMEVREVAFALSVSERTVKGDWRVGRAFLVRDLTRRS